MQTQKNKGVFITIIVLLIIFIPLSIASFLLHSMQKKDLDEKILENPNHDFYYEGRLYFYDKENQLLGTYLCKNKNGNCGLAKSSLDDKTYSLDYYEPEDLTMKPIQNKYAFITDNENDTESKIILYDIKNERVMTNYNLVKNYGIGIENELYIVADKDGKYGILSLENDPKVVVSFDYDFIGIANFINEDEMKIMSDLMAASKNGTWYLIDANGATLTVPITNEIVSYNGKHIIVKKDNSYQLVNYNNLNVLEEESYNHLSFTGKYLNQLDEYNDFTVIDLNNFQTLIEPIHVKNTDIITSKLNQEGKLDIILNDEIINTITVS